MSLSVQIFPQFLELRHNGVLRSSHQTWSSGIMPLWWKGPTRRLSKAAQKGGSVKRCTLQCADILTPPSRNVEVARDRVIHLLDEPVNEALALFSDGRLEFLKAGLF